MKARGSFGGRYLQTTFGLSDKRTICPRSIAARSTPGSTFILAPLGMYVGVQMCVSAGVGHSSLLPRAQPHSLKVRNVDGVVNSNRSLDLC